MNRISISFFTFLLAFFSSNIFSQEIDSSFVQNLSSEQIDIAKKALKNNSNLNGSTLDEDNSNDQEESLKANEVDKKSVINSSKFGYNFISTSPTSIIATGDLPLPNDYKISIGDLINVVLSGSKEKIFDMKVQLDGTVLFPELGSISVAGETFQEIKTKFKNLIQQSYIGVRIDISLKDLSAKKITIVGTVNNPGTYLVNPFTTISNSLAYSGGIKEIGSLRTIQLIRSNGENFSFDLYDLLINGDRTNDITIESGDVIIVGAANKFINISGEVKRPGTYEILPGEDLSELLTYALGFSGNANTNKITLSKLDSQSSLILKILTSNYSHSLENVISVDVFPYTMDSSSNIYVSGAVKEPGFYELDKYATLNELIDDLDFIDVYPWLAVLEQFDEKNIIKSSTLFSLKDFDTYKSIKLLPNSKIFFADLNSRNFEVNSMSSDLISDYDLQINHKQSTYLLPVYGNFKLDSFIKYLGLDMSDVNINATYISPLDNTIVIDDYREMFFTAKKYNTVSFRSPVNDLISVSIKGSIDYPGTYTLRSNSTVQDLYELIGDFKQEAFLSGIIFTRESVRQRQLRSIRKSKEDLNKALLTNVQRGVNIGDINVITALSESIEPQNLGRVAGDFSPESFSSKKTMLLDGDSFFVPKNPNVINIIGEVLNPIAFEYDKSITIRSAISQAGGYQDYADRKKVYVIKANGIIEKANRNIFTANVQLEAGDTIVVPRKIFLNNPGIQSLLPVTKILSDLAFSAAAIESLSNSN